jgi:hypothetical protein
MLPAGVMGDMELTIAGSNMGGQYQKLQIQSSAPDDGRRHLPKHVELIGNK